MKKNSVNADAVSKALVNTYEEQAQSMRAEALRIQSGSADRTEIVNSLKGAGILNRNGKLKKQIVTD